jgi:hypothetical protein
MRIIRIISDGVPIDVYDDIDRPIEEATKYVTDLMMSDKIVTLIGINSSASIRPSSISGINIIDTPGYRPKQELQQMVKQSSKNKEQKNEHVDMISDIED